MNLFILDYNPDVAAEYHCDKHVVKMILETAQMICTTAHQLNIAKVPYKATHQNHPCTKWVRESKQNMLWTLDLFYALHEEWQYRYNHENEHLSMYKLSSNLDLYGIANMLPDIGLTEFAQAMPDGYKNVDAVKAYRDYYINDKAELLTYTNRNKPSWLTKD